MIYLDNAATTFPKPESVYAAMDKMNSVLSDKCNEGVSRTLFSFRERESPAVSPLKFR